MCVAPIWFPNAWSSLVQNLQAIQNSALRVATGCIKMTSIDHLHEETKMLPVQDHLSLICSKYLARTLQPNNPSYNVVTSPRVSETRKNSLKLGFSIMLFRICRTVFFPPLFMGPPSSTIILRPFPILYHMGVLQNASPQITVKEANLLRPYRTTPSQLPS